MSYEGSCHCGAVAFEVDAPQPTQAMSCNCSHCRRKGFLLSFVPESAFRLTRGEDSLRSYFFNAHKIEHMFCTTCGTQAFARGAMPDGTPTRAVNLRCVPAVDLDALQIQRVDGASF
ncbi:aldehyde-activating protein [Pigmentiphaga sp. NML080357]|uniref:GFA family protein n=1 Tax=Pigmentiphaga sp. NML080357 TaxID=2008675 RepID=UPI000B40DDAD|nr:GFA family protein [Pigmentiphaga sp. NML080357]OVZ63694.1 aldehyde-activating protein [Pigmentiphaga sp. NML080357]